MPRTPHGLPTGIKLPDRLDESVDKGPQLRAILRHIIEESPAGTKLPSERVLAEHYSVARMTVRREVDQLVAEGAADRVGSGGTYVSDRRYIMPAFYSYTAEMASRGIQSGMRILGSAVTAAGRSQAEALGIEQGAPILELRRLLTADGQPYALSLVALDITRFPGLDAKLQDDTSLYELLGAEWGVEVSRATHRVTVESADTEIAAVLEIEEGAPNFVIESRTWDAAGAPLEWGRSVYRGDRADLHIETQQPPIPPVRFLTNSADPASGSLGVASSSPRPNAP